MTRSPNQVYSMDVADNRLVVALVGHPSAFRQPRLAILARSLLFCPPALLIIAGWPPHLGLGSAQHGAPGRGPQQAGELDETKGPTLTPCHLPCLQSAVEQRRESSLKYQTRCVRAMPDHQGWSGVVGGWRLLRRLPHLFVHSSRWQDLWPARSRAAWRWSISTRRPRCRSASTRSSATAPTWMARTRSTPSMRWPSAQSTAPLPRAAATALSASGTASTRSVSARFVNVGRGGGGKGFDD